MREKLVSLRPLINNITHDEKTSPEELFQNNTIRPILKYQNELLIECYAQYIDKHKNTFFQLNISGREAFIRESLQKDLTLKNMYLGMIMGHFTLEEFSIFIHYEKELKKRVNDMLIQRLQDQMGKFEQ